jgi:hypothetical protein
MENSVSISNEPPKCFKVERMAKDIADLCTSMSLLIGDDVSECDIRECNKAAMDLIYALNKLNKSISILLTNSTHENISIGYTFIE